MVGGVKTPFAALVAAIVLICVSGGCAAALARTEVQHQHVATLGSTITIGVMRITPAVVTEDSRCPTRAACIWTGRVVVRVTISSLTAKMTREMSMGEPVSIDGQKVVLVAVTPAKTDVPTRPAAYRFKFAVQPGATQI
jgi:hypothetical protein